MGPRAGLDRCGKSRPHWDSVPDRPAPSQSLYRLSYPAHTTHTRTLYIYRIIRDDCRGFNNSPPRSPDATPCDFFLWVKVQVYVPLLPASIPELKV